MPPKKAQAAKSKPASTGTTQAKAKATTTKKLATSKATQPLKAPSKGATKKSSPTNDQDPAVTVRSSKRKADNETNEDHVNGVGKRQKQSEAELPQARPARAGTKTRGKSPATKAIATKKAKIEKSKSVKAKVVVNEAPTQLLDLYTFGGGEAGELGFAGAKGTKEIKRPRINPYLAADKAGVVQLSVGGMHTACLTHDNKILTWGVNDQGALGRDTNWDGGLTDMKENGDEDDDDSDSDEGEINPHESTPGEVDFSKLEENPTFTQVCATDSATFAVTDEGLVYGWGTFRSNEGIFGFSPESHIQTRPIKIDQLRNIVTLTGGSNHVLALDNKGNVFAWGAGQQNQLGRRILERHQIKSLIPAKFGLPRNMIHIGCGAYHSFAVAKNGNVYSWGLNSFGQTGAEVDIEEGSGSGVHLAMKIDSLNQPEHGEITHITGGSHHSIAITSKGHALAWGRLDGYQCGIDIKTIPEADLVKDASGRPRILTVPTRIPNIEAVNVAAGSDHSIVLDRSGKAYSFGFNEYGQAGVGGTDDVETATLIDNTAVRGKTLVAVGCGGQFSVLGSEALSTSSTADASRNGVNSEKPNSTSHASANSINGNTGKDSGLESSAAINGNKK